MKVFHYCAELLKETPLFESVTDINLYKDANMSNKGSVYNDFDHNPLDFLRSKSNYASDIGEDSSEVSAPVTRPSMVVSSDINTMFLLADDKDHERWNIDHPLFDKTNHPMTAVYMSRVNLILTREVFESFPINEEMEYRYVKFETSYIISFSKKIISFKIKCHYIISINRFKIRHENDWEGYDSFYDAWLYKNKMRRKEFNHRGFRRKYPHLDIYGSDVEEEEPPQKQQQQQQQQNETDSKRFVPTLVTDNVIIVESDSDDGQVQSERKLFKPGFLSDTPILLSD